MHGSMADGPRFFSLFQLACCWRELACSGLWSSSERWDRLYLQVFGKTCGDTPCLMQSLLLRATVVMGVFQAIRNFVFFRVQTSDMFNSFVLWTNNLTLPAVCTHSIVKHGMFAYEWMMSYCELHDGRQHELKCNLLILDKVTCVWLTVGCCDAIYIWLMLSSCVWTHSCLSLSSPWPTDPHPLQQRYRRRS